jgi:two-component sensor histidine kinase
LKKNSDNAYLLVLRDNGVGYPENFNVSSSKSLGMKLIQILTHQIGGEFNCFNENGAIVEIHFKQ